MMTKRISRYLLCLLVLVSMVLGSITGIAAEEGSAKSGGGVSLEVNNKPKAEIALAVGQTKVDYSKFQEDLKAILEERGVAQEDISFVQVDANASAAKDSFVWWTYDHTNATNGKIDASKNSYVEYVGSDQYSNSYNSYANHIVTSADGKTMDFYGYGSSAYKDFNFLPNDQATKKTIEFTVTEGSAYDALDGVGFFINTSIIGSYTSNTQVINGYLVFFHYNTSGQGTTISLFKLTNVNAKDLHHVSTGKTFDSYTNISGVTRVATSDTYGNYKYRKVKIEVMPDYIKMWYNGSSSNNANLVFTDSHLVKWNSGSTTVTLTAGYDVVSEKEVYRGGYGPLISYRSHNCERLTHFTLSNLYMEAEYVRSLTEVVREPSWTDDKVSILVNLNEAAIDDFSDVYSTAEIINRLQDDNVSYIGWCSDDNYDDSQQFVTGVGQGSGLVNLEAVNDGVDPYSKDSYTLQLESIAQLIMESLQQKTSVNNEYTFLASEELKFTALSGSLSDGNWSVGYSKTDYATAKNNISTYQNLEHASFAQCGYYEIYHDGDIANPKAKIRIHDLPIAVFRATMTVEDGITVVNGSYDPEFCLTPNTATGSEIDGIKTSIFEYYNLNEENPTWVTTAPESVAEGDAWLVRLTVEDFNGATATTLQQLSVTDEEGEDVPAPYGTFKLSSTQYIKGIDLFVDIIDQSYMLNGSLDFTVQYIITNSAGTEVWNSGSDIEPGSTYQYSLNNLAEGSYTISMTASNDSKTSEKVSRTFKVVQGYSVQYVILDGEGTGAPDTQYKIKDQALTLSNFAPSRSGYTFIGWEETNGTMYQPGDEYLLNADLILTARWAYNMSYTAEGYTGTYDAAAHGIAIDVTDSNGKDAVIKYGTEYGVYDMDDMPTYTNAGTYTIYFQITAEGCQTVTNSRTVVINKAMPTVINNNTVVSYDGTAKELTPSVITGVVSGDVTTGAVTYTYYVDENCTILTTEENSGAATEGGAPILKGIYYVIVSIESDMNYSSYTSGTVTLTIRKYDVVFDMGGIGVAPGTIKDVIAGSTIDEPEIPVSDDYIFIGWFKDANFETPWDFAMDEVVSDTTLYAKWKAKSSYECYWEDPETGEYKYGTFDEAIDSGTNNIVIQNDITIDENVIIPPDVTIAVIPSDVEITVADDVVFENKGNIIGGKLNGDLINNGTIEGAEITGSVDNAGGIIEDSTIAEDGKVSGGEVTGSTTNKGTIEGSNISGNLDNTNGKLEDAVIADDGSVSGGEVAGDTTNKGKIEGATIAGPVNNAGGTIEDAVIAEDGTVSGGEVTGDTVNNGVIEGAEISGNLDNTNGTLEDATVTEDGTVSGGEVTGDTVNNGTIEGSKISGTVDNTNGKLEDAVIAEDGSVSGGEVAGDTVNNGIIEGSKISGTVDNANGTIEDATVTEDGTVSGGEVAGDTVNNGIIEGSKISGTVDNTNGTIEDATVTEDGTVSGGEVAGDTVNNGTIEGSKISGTVDNANGTIEDATVTEDGTVSGGEVTGDTVNNGIIEGSKISGTVDNANGTIEDATVTEDGTVSGGEVAGDTTNKGKIEGATIAGPVNNAGGTIEDAVIAEDGSVSGGEVAGDTVNNGTIEGSKISGTVDNANGTIEDATVTEDGTVSGGEVTGDTTNKGKIEGATIAGPVNNAGGTIEDATVTEDGTVSGGEVTGDTVNNGTIEGSKISGTVDNTNGKLEDAVIAEDGSVSGGEVAGDTVNNGVIEGAEISGNLDNTNGTLEDATVTEDGSVSGGEVTGDTVNNGTIEGSKISGTVDNINGKLEDAVIAEDGSVSGGEVAGDTVNNGVIEGAEISGNLDNTNGTLEDATVTEDGTVSGGEVTGDTVNNGTIEGAEISGTVDNAGGTIEDAIVAEDGTVSGGQVTGDTVNNGTIEGAEISGNLDNTNGILEDAAVTADGTVNGGNVTGDTVNNGVIEDVKVSGTVTGDGEVENDQEYVNEQIDKVEEALTDDTVTDKTEVDFGNGKIQVDLVVNETPDEDGKVIVSGLIISSRKDVIDAVLSNDAKLDVINGKRVYIELVIEPMENQNKKTEIDQMQAMFDEDEKVVIGQILDIVIQKKVDANDWEKISDLSNEIEIVIDVPENLRFSGATYYIVRNHNGECTVLQDLDDNPDTITFKTDKFSTYAIAYDKNDDCSLCGICSTPLGMCVIIWIAIAVVVVAGVVVTVIIVRKRKNTVIE